MQIPRKSYILHPRANILLYGLQEVQVLQRGRDQKMTEDFFKIKYWSQTSTDFLMPSKFTGREYLVLGRLLIKLAEWRERDLIPQVYIKPSGIGTLSTTLNYEHYHDLLDKYDFVLYFKARDQYYPGLFLDITGSSWTREESEKRYGEEVWAVLSVKVEIAQRNDIMGRTFFIFYNDAEDRLKVISALQVINLHKQGKIRLDKYEEGAKNYYYLVPPRYWKSIVELRVAIKGYYQSFLEYLARKAK